MDNLKRINNEKKKVFDFNEMPVAFLSDNKMSNKLRDKLMIKSLTTENDIGAEYLSQHFYSEENMEIINKMLVMDVFKKSNRTIKIPFQSKSDLMVTMRWVYINYARNLPFKVKEQILELNREVVNQLSSQLLSQAQQHIDYLRDIEKPRVPLPPPISTLRDNTLPSLSSVYF